MIPFCGRTKHKVKMKNKPIDEGYKVWALAQQGYTLSWRWHSREEGPEGVSKGLQVPQIEPFPPVILAPTFAVVIILARDLRAAFPIQKFHLFLDNLFLNVPMVHCLLHLNILCTGTTRKNATGIPEWLVELKDQNRTLI